LLPSLKDEWYRLPELGGIWSPDVRVFSLPGVGPDAGKDVELAKTEQFYVNVVSAAMLRFPEIDTRPERASDGEEVQVYANERDREQMFSKIRGVMWILCAKGTKKVVLGAWGCGAYGNPIDEVARAWKKVLLGTEKDKARGKKRAVGSDGNWGYLESVMFAIKDPKMAKHFGSVFEVDVEEPADMGEEGLEEVLQDEN